MCDCDYDDGIDLAIDSERESLYKCHEKAVAFIKAAPANLSRDALAERVAAILSGND